MEGEGLGKGWQKVPVPNLLHRFANYPATPYLELCQQGLEFCQAYAGRGLSGARLPLFADLLDRELGGVRAQWGLRFRRGTPLLATVGNVSPFIGLFGTVWGIIDAFQGISKFSSVSLKVVAPGISEALIATAAGLFAAIPAVVAYNLFVQRARLWDAELERFSLWVSARLLHELTVPRESGPAPRDQSLPFQPGS